MSFFSKLFKTNNKENNSPSSNDFGAYLFGLCLRNTNSFLNDLNEQSQKNKNLMQVNADDIGDLELLIAFMWLYFDFLQIEKFRKSLDVMHKHFSDFVRKNEGDGKLAYELLSDRYDEYRQNFRGHDTPDYTYTSIAPLISANIQRHDSLPNIILQSMISIYFQESIRNAGEKLLDITPIN